MQVVRSRRIAALAAVGAGMLALPAGAQAQHAKALVFFAKGEQLSAVPRTVSYRRPLVQGLALRSLRALQAGPTRTERRRGVYSGFEEKLVVRAVRLKNGVAIVYAPHGVVPGGHSRARFRLTNRLRLAQITYTLTDYPAITSVTVVTTSAAGKRVEFKGLTRKYFRIATAPNPNVPLPPWKGPQPGNIRSVQVALVDLRYLPARGVSGQADYRTQQALFAFQAWNGLDRTGYVDSATLARLRALNASPRGPHPRYAGAGRHAEVYRDKGVLLLVENGKTVQAVHVSTGADGRTSAGTFSIYRKELYSWSVPFSVWLPYASYFDGGRAFHEYPDVPPYPASHGCIRVSAPEAPFVYDFLDYGTTVDIF